MSLAESVEQLYAFEPACESAISSIFGARGFVCYATDDGWEFDKDHEAVHIVVRQTEATGHMRVMPDKSQRPDTWNALLAVQLVTKAGVNHAAKRATLRAECAKLFPRLNSDERLPFWRISGPLMDSGTTSVIKSDSGYESSTMVYRVHYHIRPDAWPASEGLT